MFQSRIGNVSGASETFPGGFVTYSADAKEQLLNIPTEIIKNTGLFLLKLPNIWQRIPKIK